MNVGRPIAFLISEQMHHKFTINKCATLKI